MTPEEIFQLRTRLGWSMYEMARQLGVSRSTIWAWEHGQNQPDPMRLAVLRQLRGRLNEAEEQRSQQEFVNKISGVAAGLGVGFLLGVLFKGGTVEDERPGEEGEGQEDPGGDDAAKAGGGAT